LKALKLEYKKTVLLIDDEESIRKAFTGILENAGYVVDTADSGQIALEKVKAKHYDVALVDMKLPDMEGTDLLLKLPKNSEMVKIIITGFSTMEIGVKAADCGANDFLVKPVKPQELLNAIKEGLAELSRLKSVV
jgi:DNA-binding NtrC family response regulator